MLYTFSFFILVSVVSMKIIFGIIIDSFKRLREVSLFSLFSLSSLSHVDRSLDSLTFSLLQAHSEHASLPADMLY